MGIREDLEKRLEALRQEQQTIFEKIAADPSVAVERHDDIERLAREVKEITAQIEKIRKKKRSGGNALIDAKIKALAPKDKTYYEADGLGLSLKVKPSGAKIWCFRYRIHGKSRLYTIGDYPEIGLAKARQILHDLRAKVESGIDPLEERQAQIEALRRQETEERIKSEHTFARAVDSYLRNIEGRTSRTHYQRSYNLLHNYALPSIADIPIAELEPKHFKPIFNAMVRNNKLESARKLRTAIKRLYAHVSTLEGEWLPEDYRDPMDAPSIKEILARKPGEKVASHATLLKPTEIAELLERIDRYQGNVSTKQALRFALLTALRSKNVRFARWDWLDLEEKKIVVPAEEMKTGQEFHVPLSRQALEVIKEAALFRRSDYIFPSADGGPMSENAMMYALKNMGYDSTQQTVHGFRAMFSTISREEKLGDHETIETALAHKLGDIVSQVYNRADYFRRRAELMQRWADWLDGIRDA